MLTEADFLAKVLEEPVNDDTRLVYADWLDERGDPVSSAKAEFLRVTVQLTARNRKKGWKKAARKRLQQLAADLDTSWLAVVSRLTIENCFGKRTEEETSVRLGRATVLFDYICDRRWEDLRTTEDQAVRACDGCKQNVHYCDTITEAREHAGAGHCIAVDLGVIRRENDLEPRRMWLGQPSAEMLRQEEGRVQPDAVSAERERRKRSQQAESGQA